MNPGLGPGSRGLSRLPGRAVLWPLKKAALGGLRGWPCLEGPSRFGPGLPYPLCPRLRRGGGWGGELRNLFSLPSVVISLGTAWGEVGVQIGFSFFFLFFSRMGHFESFY